MEKTLPPFCELLDENGAGEVAFYKARGEIGRDIVSTSYWRWV
jgi:hypothetical protein